MERQILAISDLGTASYLFALRIPVLRLQADPLNPRRIQIVFDNHDGAATRAEIHYAGGAVMQAQRLIDCYTGLKSMVLNHRDNQRGGAR
jgi:hypothetical protein